MDVPDLPPVHNLAVNAAFPWMSLAVRQVDRQLQGASYWEALGLLMSLRQLLRAGEMAQAQVAIGISVDEIHRARDADVAYMRNAFPLLDLGWHRDDCRRYLNEQGLTGFVKSSCLRCPFHDDGFWTRLKTDSPHEWADAVAFDRAIRRRSTRANVASTRCAGSSSCTASGSTSTRSSCTPGPPRTRTLRGAARGPVHTRTNRQPPTFPRPPSVTRVRRRRGR
jgi:hypothetical protein